MGRSYRKYQDGNICHVYCKAVNGNIIFYSSRDIIFYLTLYYHLARRYGIVTRAIAIMPNHVHSNEQARTTESFISFHRDLNRIFTKETAQLTDRIISMHNCLDYNRIAKYYNGSIENAVLAISANSGTEYDIKEDSEDYSLYRTMTKIALKQGVDLKQCNFEAMDVEQLARLADKFLWAGVPPRLVCKFLHIERLK